MKATSLVGGTSRRNQSEELVGVVPAQGGQDPVIFVSCASRTSGRSLRNPEAGRHGSFASLLAVVQ